MTQDVKAVEAGVIAPFSTDSLRPKLGKIISTWKNYPLGIIGLVIIVSIVLLAIFAPYVSPYEPREFAGNALEAPSAAFPMGTNNLGQDVLSRTIHGAQVSIAVGLSAA